MNKPSQTPINNIPQARNNPMPAPASNSIIPSTKGKKEKKYRNNSIEHLKLAELFFRSS